MKTEQKNPLPKLTYEKNDWVSLFLITNLHRELQPTCQYKKEEVDWFELLMIPQLVFSAGLIFLLV